MPDPWPQDAAGWRGPSALWRGLDTVPGALPQAGMDAGLWPSIRIALNVPDGSHPRPESPPAYIRSPSRRHPAPPRGEIPRPPGSCCAPREKSRGLREVAAPPGRNPEASRKLLRPSGEIPRPPGSCRAPREKSRGLREVAAPLGRNPEASRKLLRTSGEIPRPGKSSRKAEPFPLAHFAIPDDPPPHGFHFPRHHPCLHPSNVIARFADFLLCISPVSAESERLFW